MLAFLLSLLYSALIVLLCASQWVIFQKAGKRGWYSLIPVYGTLVMLQIIEKPWWWLFLFLIPGVNIIWVIWMLNLLSKSFGKNEGFTVGLLFLMPVFFPILGFGGSKYLGPAGAQDFNPANPPEIPAREYNLINWLIIIVLLLIINGLFGFIVIRFGLYYYQFFVSSVLFGTIPLITAGLLKNKTWRIILIILGTISLAIQLQPYLKNIMDSM